MYLNYLLLLQKLNQFEWFLEKANTTKLIVDWFTSTRDSYNNDHPNPKYSLYFLVKCKAQVTILAAIYYQYSNLAISVCFKFCCDKLA